VWSMVERRSALLLAAPSTSKHDAELDRIIGKKMFAAATTRTEKIKKKRMSIDRRARKNKNRIWSFVGQAPGHSNLGALAAYKFFRFFVSYIYIYIYI